MTRRASARFAILFAVLALALCPAPAGAETPRAERPTYRVGDRWIRNDGTYELTRIEKDLYVFSAGSGNEIHLTKDLGVARVVRGGQVELDVEPPAKLTWPLKVGTWGSALGVLRSNPPKALNQFSGSVRLVWAVEAYEEVRGPAGAFEAFKVVHRIETPSSAMSSTGTLWEFTMWYAPAPRQFVKALSPTLASLNFELAAADRPSAPPVIVSPLAPASPAIGGPPAPAPPSAAPPQAVTTAQAAKAERPTYQVGDKWIRNDGTYELTRIDKDVYVFTAGPGKEIHLTKDLGIAKVLVDRRVEFDIEPARGLRWPLEIGTGGVKSALWRSPLSRPLMTFAGEVTVHWRVEAYEDVGVAAGSFGAFRIAYDIEFRMASVGRFSLWYAPSVQRFVKAQGTLNGLNFELASVDRPAAPPVVAAPPAPPPPVPAPPAVAPAPPVVAQPAPPVVRAPPVITLLEPKPGALLRGDQVTLKVDVRGDGRPKTLVVKGRGGDKAFTPPASARAGEPWVIDATVPLAEGSNVVRLEAVDEFGSRAAETVTLTRQSLIAVEFQGPPGAAVTVDQDRHTLDPQGRLTVQLPPGTYQIAATKEGYIPLRRTLRLAPGQGRALERLALVQAVPPAIAVLDPKPGTLLRTPDAKLRIEVKSRYRLSALRVGKDNESAQQTFAPSAGAKPGETWTVDVLVLLGEGDNRFRLEAVDEHGTRAEQRVTVTRQSPVALELRGPPGAEVQIDNTRYTLDAQGALALQLAPGTYRIEAKKEGFTASRESVTLSPGQAPTRRRLALAPLPPQPPRVGAPPAAATASGSGFLLRNSNLVLTNYHVVAGRTQVRLVFPSGEEYEGRVAFRDRSNDLALVEARGLAGAGRGLVVAVNAQIKVGETVHALGYPLGAGLSRQPSMVSGAVSSTVGLDDDISRFRTTAPINPGDSGGPIVNARGQVVGIAVAGLVRQDIEAIRFGIKASAAALILQQARVTTGFDIAVEPAEGATRGPEEVFERISPHVVLIEPR